MEQTTTQTPTQSTTQTTPQTTQTPPESSFYEYFKCTVCLELAKDIVESSCCHQVYCERCLIKSKAQKNECPSCRKTGFQVLVCHLGRRLINTIPTSCPYKCSVKLTIGDLEAHKKVCPQKLYNCPEDGCEDFEGDNKSFTEHIMEKHMEKIAEMFGNLHINNSLTKSGTVTGFFVQGKKESVMKGKFIMEEGHVYICTEDWFGHSGWKGEIEKKDLTIKLMKIYNPINEIIYRGKFNKQLTRLVGNWSWQKEGKEILDQFIVFNKLLQISIANDSESTLQGKESPILITLTPHVHLLFDSSESTQSLFSPQQPFSETI